MICLVRFLFILVFLAINHLALFGQSGLKSSVASFNDRVKVVITKDINGDKSSVKRIDRFDENRDLIREEYFINEKLWQVVNFSYYKGSGLLKTRQVIEDGVKIEDLSYYYHNDGSVWFTKENNVKFSYYLDNKLLIYEDEQTSLINDIKDGHLNSSSLIVGGKITQNAIYGYDSKKRITSMTLHEDNNTLKELYDEKGRLSLRNIFVGDSKIEELILKYDDKGRVIVRSAWQNEQVVDRIENFYKGNSLSKQLRYVDNELVQKTVFTGSKNREEYYYVNEKVVLYELYVNGVKKAEEEYHS